MNKSLIHAKIDAALKADAEKLAERLGVPLSVVVTAVLRKFVADGGVEIREYAPGAADIEKEVDDEFRAPSVEKYAKALRALMDKGVLKPWGIELLRAHYESPNREIFSTVLAKRLGWKGYQAVNRWYSHLGKVVAKEMKVEISHKYIDAVILCSYKEVSVPGKKQLEWQLTMRDEVAQALETAGIVSK